MDPDMFSDVVKEVLNDIVLRKEQNTIPDEVYSKIEEYCDTLHSLVYDDIAIRWYDNFCEYKKVEKNYENFLSCQPSVKVYLNYPDKLVLINKLENIKNKEKEISTLISLHKKLNEISKQTPITKLVINLMKEWYGVVMSIEEYETDKFEYFLFLDITKEEYEKYNKILKVIS